MILANSIELSEFEFLKQFKGFKTENKGVKQIGNLIWHGKHIKFIEFGVNMHKIFNLEVKSIFCN